MLIGRLLNLRGDSLAGGPVVQYPGDEFTIYLLTGRGPGSRCLVCAACLGGGRVLFRVVDLAEKGVLYFSEMLGPLWRRVCEYSL